MALQQVDGGAVLTDRRRRLVLASVGVVAFIAAHGVFPMGLRMSAVPVMSPLDWAGLSLGAMALAPWLTAAVLVECLLVLVPAWRRFRMVGADRGRVEQATRMVWLAVCLVQSYSVAIGMEAMQVGWSTLVIHPGGTFRLFFVLTATATSAAVGWVAFEVRQRGLGSAFVWFVMANTVWQYLLYPIPWNILQLVELDDVLPLVACVCIATVTTTSLLAARGRTGMWLSTAGTVPATSAIAVMYWVAFRFPSFWRLPWGVAVAVLVALLGVVFGLVAARPKSVARELGVSVELARFDARWAAVVGGGYSLLLYVLWWAPMYADALLFADVITLVVTMAIAWDIVSEWKARSGKTLVTAGAVHRVRDVQLVLDALTSAGIDGHVRGVRLRQLTHFLSPWAAMDVLVAQEDVDRTRGLMSREYQRLVKPDTTPSSTAS